MNIALGKIGKSILFGPKEYRTTKKSMTTGSIDARVCFESMIRFNPEHTFYIIGRSNYSRLPPEIQDKINVHGNVIDIWSGFKEWKKTVPKDVPEEHYPWMYIDYWLDNNDVEFDAGSFLAGGVLEYAVQGKTLKEGKPIKTLVAASNYAGPIHHFINRTKLPYTILLTDPRCYPKPTKDLMVMPKRVLSQYSEPLEVTHKVTYECDEMVTEKVDAVYSGIESLYVVEEQWDEKEDDVFSLFDEPEPEPVERDINMMLFLNEGSPSRFNDLKKYVLDAVEDVKVYGSWSEKPLEDPRIEQVPMAECEHLIPRIKYTFCIPIAPGWCTGKFWEMAKLGMVPFVHPTYDEQNNIGIPEELRVKDANDLLEKINVYNNDEKEYNRILAKLQDMLTDDHKSGKYINDMIMKNIMEIVEQ